MLGRAALEMTPEALGYIVSHEAGTAASVIATAASAMMDLVHRPSDLRTVVDVELAATTAISLAEYAQFPDSPSLSAEVQRYHAIADLGRVANLMDNPLRWRSSKDRIRVRQIAVESAIPLIRLLVETGDWGDVWAVAQRTRRAVKRLAGSDSQATDLLSATRLFSNMTYAELAVEATCAAAYAAKKRRLDKKVALRLISEAWDLAKCCPPQAWPRMVIDIAAEAAIPCVEMPPKQIDDGLRWVQISQQRFRSYDSADRELLLAMHYETEARVYHFGELLSLARSSIVSAESARRRISHGSIKLGTIHKVRILETEGRLQLVDGARRDGLKNLERARRLALGAGIRPKVAAIERDLSLWS